MRLFRFKDAKRQNIEEITLDALDLVHNRTLFIFPGMDNPSPKGPYPAERGTPDHTTYGKMTSSLPRGVTYAQRAQRHGEPFQVVMATWDSDIPECEDRMRQLAARPAKFYSGEAEKFVRGLYKKGFNPNKVSILGWSYGSAFLQECANTIRLNPELEAGRPQDETNKTLKNGLPPLYATTTATVTNLGNNNANGFPGFYMYAWNDKKLKKYVGDDQETLYKRIVLGGRSMAVIKNEKRPDHVMAVVTAADKATRQRHLPASEHMMKRKPDFRQWKLEAAKPYPDLDCHAPVLFMEAIHNPNDPTQTSTYTDENGKVCEAWRHSRYYGRAFLNILCREGPIDYKQMLFDHSNAVPITNEQLKDLGFFIKRWGQVQRGKRAIEFDTPDTAQQWANELQTSRELEGLLSDLVCDTDEDGLMLTSPQGSHYLEWYRDAQKDVPVPIPQRDEEEATADQALLNIRRIEIQKMLAPYSEKIIAPDQSPLTLFMTPDEIDTCREKKIFYKHAEGMNYVVFMDPESSCFTIHTWRGTLTAKQKQKLAEALDAIDLKELFPEEHNRMLRHVDNEERLKEVQQGFEDKWSNRISRVTDNEGQRVERWLPKGIVIDRR